MRRIGDLCGWPPQRRGEVNALRFLGGEPERFAIIDIEHDIDRRAAGLQAGIEDPAVAEPVEPGAVGNEGLVIHMA